MTVQDAIAKLTADVAAEATADQSAITLLQGLTAEIKALQAQIAAGVDPAQISASLEALATSIESNTTALASAVTANTPAAPPTSAPSA